MNWVLSKSYEHFFRNRVFRSIIPARTLALWLLFWQRMNTGVIFIQMSDRSQQFYAKKYFRKL